MARTLNQHRVIIVDDHPLMRRGLKELVIDEPQLEFCGEASNGIDGVKLAKKENPDLMILDLGLPDQGGLEVIKRVEAASSVKTRILVCSIQDETLFAERCIRAGAMGYVNKAEPPEKMLEAVFRVLEGDVYLSPEMTRRLLKGVAGKGKADVPTIERLTDRELEVFDLLGRGLATREIADRLKLSIKTIETHRDKIKTKLEISSTSALTRHAVQWVLEHG